MQERSGRQNDAIDVARWIFQRLAQREFRLPIVLGDELPMHMTGADADFEHDRRVRRLGQLEALLDHAHECRQIRARIEQPDLRFQRIGVAALLHDGRAFAVILADDDHRAAGDAARREIGERVGGDIRSGSRFPGHRAAQRIHDRRRKRRRGGRLRSRRLEMHAKFVEHVLRVGEHVHQMGDRRPLIAADIGDAGLQQRLGDGENALAAEHFPGAELQVLDLASE